MAEKKNITGVGAVREFFAPISVKEIKEFKDSDPEGYEEVKRLCEEHYAE